MIEEKKYPISEIFTSWQGEGLYSGTRMTFIRFAGCNVGKPIAGAKSFDLQLNQSKDYGTIPIWQEECTSWDGRKFLCDTDFRVKERLTAKEIINLVPKDVEHIVLTGGEPLIHGLHPLVYSAYNKVIHIETSGTRPMPSSEIWDKVWVTVSPKKDCLMEMAMRANEIKLLVDDKFDEQKAEALASYVHKDCVVWLSSINDVNSLDKANMDKCKEIAERHPTWRITQQSHKIWNVR
jgi:7-carboxy-7-deazaguanine synthase